MFSESQKAGEETKDKLTPEMQNEWLNRRYRKEIMYQSLC